MRGIPAVYCAGFDAADESLHGNPARLARIPLKTKRIGFGYWGGILIPGGIQKGTLHIMETSGGFFGRLAEKVVGWLALALIVGAGIAIWQMGPVTRGAIWDAAWRSAAWFAGAAIVPWSAWFYVRPVLGVGSNWAGVGLIAGLCCVDLLLAGALMTGWPTGGWGWFGGLAALGLAGTYNFLVVEYLADRAEGI